MTTELLTEVTWAAVGFIGMYISLLPLAAVVTAIIWAMKSSDDREEAEARRIGGYESRNRHGNRS